MLVESLRTRADQGGRKHKKRFLGPASDLYLVSTVWTKRVDNAQAKTALGRDQPGRHETTRVIVLILKKEPTTVLKGGTSWVLTYQRAGSTALSTSLDATRAWRIRRDAVARGRTTNGEP